VIEAFVMLVWGIVPLAVFISGVVWDELKGSREK
jgi:hypothetical protein